MRSAIAGLVILAAIAALPACMPRAHQAFDSQYALSLVEEQLRFGPRIPGSPASTRTAEWIGARLLQSGWEVSSQTSIYHGTTLVNVIAKRGPMHRPPVVLGTHYDTRPRADRDPVNPDLPVPGANDGGSGVAVLLALARALSDVPLHDPIWLVFFDGEDSGGLNGWEWSAGAASFARQLEILPQAVVIVDMVGDRDLHLPRERTSDPVLGDEIWALAADLGMQAFVDEPGPAVLDDHRPFLDLDVPAVLLIDLDYPAWHTTQDTLDKVSADSLGQVGEVLLAWLLSHP